jgi:N-methylhydantoinase A
MEQQVARPLGRDSPEAAYGVLQVAGSTMVRAVKAVSTYRGRDPRDFTLYAFGGNGPLVGALIADLLEMRRVMIPPHPGVFSAYGLMHARVEHEITRAHFVRLGDSTPALMSARFEELESELLARMSAEGYSRDQLHLMRFADLRYAGQAHEITTPVPGGEPDFARLAEAFGNEHERTYGHQAEREEVECVALRAVARVPNRPFESKIMSFSDGKAKNRKAYFGPRHGKLDAPVIGRGGLSSASRPGPLIVEEYDATCVVPPGWSASLDRQGNMVLGK